MLTTCSPGAAVRGNVSALGGQWARAAGRPLLAAAFLIAALPAQAHAAKLCGWFVEKVGADKDHNVELWLQSNEHVWFLYRIAGKGFYGGDGGVDVSSSGGTTFSTDPGEPKSAWSAGSTLGPGDHIDIVVEIHAFPHDPSDDTEQPPLLGTFAYRRTVTANAERPSTSSPRQCFEATFPDS
jgi:hypothetical protein